jgi:nitrate reductase NapD
MPDDLSRRQLLNSLFPDDREPTHVCSLLVHARPERVRSVIAELGAARGVEVHQRDAAGKIVVTIESGSDDHLIQTMGWIGELPGVLSTALVFQHSGIA